MAKPIDKNYLIASLKNFDEKILSQKYNQGGNSGESVDLTNYYTKTETESFVNDKISTLDLGEDNIIESVSVDGVVLIPDENGNVDIIMPAIPSTDGLVSEDKLTETLADYVKTKNSHTHDNKTVIDKLTESDDGKLLFDGNEIQNGAGTQGEAGKSAYEIAQGNGFEGTEEEWLESLKGNEGRSIASISMDENNNVIVTFSDGTTETIGQLDIDVQADFLTETGFGNLRYYNGVCQYYDTETSTWIDTSITPDNTYIINMVPQGMKSIRGIYDVELDHYKLKFEEPDDTVIEDQVASIVEKIVIRRKLNDIPTSETDGELVIEIGRKDFGLYKDNWYIDESFTPTDGETWYYKAFPVNTLGFVSTSSSNETHGLLCKDYYLFGFTLDTSESDPASMISYIEDNKDFSSAYMNYTTGYFNYGDWGDSWFIKNLKPVMLNYDGTVTYELNKEDYTLKVDGTASDIADATFEGNAMMGFPKVYWKVIDNSDGTANIYISNKQVDEDFHCWSHLDNNGEEIDYCYMPIYNGYNDGTRLRSLSGKIPIYSQTGTTEISLAKANNLTDDVIWYTEVYSDRMLVDLLLLLIGKSTNTQAVFGNGYYTGGSQNSNPRIATGTMNDKGLFWGSNGSSMVGVKVFGMEHWWGNQWRRIAGWINNKGTQKIKLTYGQSDGSTVDGYNTDGTGYISIGCTPSGTSGGYINKMTITEYGLIPTTASGSATTYFTDGLWFNNSQVDYAFVGGYCMNDFLVGALYCNLNNLVSFASWSHGAALSCKPLKTT